MVPNASVDRSHGFTLVEILVVMAIFAAMALVGVPYMLKIAQRNALKSAAREISVTLAAARMTAVKQNQPVTVAIGSVTPPIQFLTIQSAPLAGTPTPVPQLLILPRNAARFLATPVGGTVIFGGDGRLSNPPLTPSVITVEGPTNSIPRNSISISTAVNGRIQVITPVDWK
ncbi:MAG: GspH/FimT family pseudopilin [Acidobacteriota bacterium]